MDGLLISINDIFLVFDSFIVAICSLRESGEVFRACECLCLSSHVLLRGTSAPLGRDHALRKSILNNQEERSGEVELLRDTSQEYIPEDMQFLLYNPLNSPATSSANTRCTGNVTCRPSRQKYWSKGTPHSLLYIS